jgi:hypothetical protein
MTTPYSPNIRNNTFVITEYSKTQNTVTIKTTSLYRNTRDESINQGRFLNALAGPKGEEITFKKLESCCPFPTKEAKWGWISRCL